MTRTIVMQKRKHPAWLRATWIASLCCACAGGLAHAATTSVTASPLPMHSNGNVQDKSTPDALDLMLFLHRHYPAPAAH